MKKHLSQANVITLYVITFCGFLIFALNTDLDNLGLSAARHPERWAIWRHATVDGWLFISFSIYLLRKKQAYCHSYLYAVIFSAVIALLLSSIWIGGSDLHGIAVIGCALFYSLISGLLCMTLQNKAAAGLTGALLLIIQLAVDIVVLGLAGEFRIH